MAWPVLLLSAIFEAVWATALGLSNGLREPVAATVFVVALVLSMAGLGWSARQIPIGTAYAVWTGFGAALTVGYALITGLEPVSALKVVFLAGIIVAVVGLQVVSSGPSATSGPAKPRSRDVGAPGDAAVTDSVARPAEPGEPETAGPATG